MLVAVFGDRYVAGWTDGAAVGLCGVSKTNEGELKFDGTVFIGVMWVWWKGLITKKKYTYD